MSAMNDDGSDSKVLARRDALAALGVLGTLGAIAPLSLLACGSDGQTSPADGASGTDAAATTDAVATRDVATGSCAEIPDETGGPYPDVKDMIASTTYQRADITEGKTGTPLTLTLNVVNVADGCTPVVGARVIVWQCDANGVYSEYASTQNSDPGQGETGSTTTTYLRGWQVTDSDGNVTFTTIYPGWYTPRVTHIHLMVYNPSDLKTAVKTTQLCFPDAINQAVYAQASLYPKGQNTTLDAGDMVFGGDGGDLDLVATISGAVTTGYTASLQVGLSSY
jgi:protocatechuate 3,4-dioxygenase beta subunit